MPTVLPLTIELDTPQIPLLNAQKLILPETIPVGSGILGMLEVNALAGKTETATLVVAMVDGELTETLTVTDDLGLGIPAVLGAYTAGQKISSTFLKDAIIAADPSGLTFTGFVRVGQPVTA